MCYFSGNIECPTDSLIWCGCGKWLRPGYCIVYMYHGQSASDSKQHISASFEMLVRALSRASPGGTLNRTFGECTHNQEISTYALLDAHRPTPSFMSVSSGIRCSWIIQIVGIWAARYKTKWENGREVIWIPNGSVSEDTTLTHNIRTHDITRKCMGQSEAPHVSRLSGGIR